MRILITGSRSWSDKHVIAKALHDATYRVSPRDVVVVHGGARGADALAGAVAHEWEFDVEVHPADWDRHGKSAGPRRNDAMVSLGADICLAFPLGESRGTRHCMAAAEKAGIPVIVHEGVTS